MFSHKLIISLRLIIKAQESVIRKGSCILIVEFESVDSGRSDYSNIIPREIYPFKQILYSRSAAI